MVMHTHIPVVPRHIMAHIDFPNQPRVPQYAQRVVDGIARHHRLLTLHHPVEIIGAGVTGSLSQCCVYSCTLAGDTYGVPAKTRLNLLRR